MNIAIWKSLLNQNQKMTIARQLSLDSRYIDDISLVNYQGFGKTAKEMYHPSLLLECSNTGYHNDILFLLKHQNSQRELHIDWYIS